MSVVSSCRCREVLLIMWNLWNLFYLFAGAAVLLIAGAALIVHYFDYPEDSGDF